MAKPTIVGLNTDTPLADGLIFAVCPGGTQNNELVNNVSGTLHPSGSWGGSTADGSALESTSTSNGGAYWPFTASGFTDKATIVFYGELDNGVTNSRFFNLPITNTSTNAFGELELGRYTSANTGVFAYKGTATRIAVSDAGYLTYADGLNQYAVVRDGATVKFYKNGSQFGTSKAITNETIVLPAGINAAVFNRNSGAAGEGFDGRAHTVLVYNRALTDNDISDLYDDPFIVFRLPPSAPTNVTATALDQTTIQVSYDPVVDANGYIVQYSLDRVTWSTGGTTITALADARYYIRVYATNAAGSSPYSEIVSIMTPKYPDLQVRYLADWDGDGYMHRHLALTDAESEPANVIFNNATDMVALGLLAGAGSSTFTQNPTEADAAYAYGLRYVDWTTGTNTAAQLAIGYNMATYGQISLSLSTQYTLVLWFFSGNPAADTVNLRLDVLADNTGIPTAVAIGSTFNILSSAGFTRQTLTFTSSALTDRHFVRLVRPSSSANITIAVLGLMVVQGSTPPTKFNAGPVSFYENFSEAVASSSWNVGFKDLFLNNFVADENLCEIELIDSERRFSPENDNSINQMGFVTLNPLLIIEASNDEGVTWERMYTGYIEHRRPEFGRSETVPRTQITAVSGRRLLQGRTTRIDLQISKTSKQVINALLAEAVTPDGSTLALTSGSPSGQTYPYAADNWEDRLDLLRAIHDIVGADGMIFYFNRNDEPVTDYLYNYYGLMVPTIDYYLGSQIARGGAEYEFAETFIKSVEYSVYPRRISATADKVLWELTNNIDLAAGEVVEVIARYTNEKEDRTIGATNVTYDLLAGSPDTTNVVVTLTPKATSCIITFDASARVTSTSITAIRLKGRKITAFDKLYERRERSISSLNGLEQNFDFKSLASRSRAKDITLDLLSLYGRGRGRVRWFELPFRRNRWNEFFLNAQFGTVVAIDDEQNSGHNRPYIITGESHRFDGKKRRSRYYLEMFIFDVGII